MYKYIFNVCTNELIVTICACLYILRVYAYSMCVYIRRRQEYFYATDARGKVHTSCTQCARGYSGVLPCVAASWSMLQCVAVCCSKSARKLRAMHSRISTCVAVCCRVLQRVAEFCSISPRMQHAVCSQIFRCLKRAQPSCRMAFHSMKRALHSYKRAIPSIK